MGSAVWKTKKINFNERIGFRACMNKELKFELTLSEHNCPGVADMTDAEVKECAIELAMIEKASQIPQGAGNWLADIFGKSSGIYILFVTFQYDDVTRT